MRAPLLSRRRFTVPSSTVLLLSVLLLAYLDGVDCIQCQVNAIPGVNICTENRLWAHCTISLQDGRISQGCGNSLAIYVECGKLEIFDPDSSTPYFYCCTQDFCNTEEVFLQLIAASTASPSPVLSSSSTIAVTQTSSLQHLLSTTGNISPSPSHTAAATGPHTAATGPLSSSWASSVMASSSSVNGNTVATSQVDSTRQVTFLVLTPTAETTPSSTGVPTYVIAVVTVLSVAIFLFVAALMAVLFIYFNPRHVVGVAVPTESEGTPTISTGSCEFSSNQDLFDGTTSGSGSGLPLLIQRSVAAQVTLREIVGKGRFGEVWRGSYKGDAVAVKVFHTKEEASWVHEVHVYQTCLIRHPNILRFIAADNKDIGIATQLWLITEYCDLGSLYEVLSSQVFDERTVLKLSHTAVSGLSHLHSEITGTEGKPAIAHRDLKSRNILVKADYSCCIADLGLALRYDRATDTVEEPPTKRVGTRRYLSPEILDDSMSTKNFDFFKRSDMYSFGLVLWEIARRGLCEDVAEECQLPYYDLVTQDPSFEDMKRVVAVDRKRPSFPNRWSNSKVFSELSQIIEQCWLHNGEARLTALRVKKNLANLQSSLHSEVKEHLTTNQIQVSL